MGASGPSGLPAGKEAREAKPFRLLPSPKPPPSSNPSFLEPPPHLGRAPPCTPGTKRKLLFVPQCNQQGAISASCAPASVLLTWFSIKTTLSVKFGRAPCLPPRAAVAGCTHIGACTDHPSLGCDQRKKQSPRAISFHAQDYPWTFFKKGGALGSQRESLRKD